VHIYAFERDDKRDAFGLHKTFLKFAPYSTEHTRRAFHEVFRYFLVIRAKTRRLMRVFGLQTGNCVVAHAPDHLALLAVISVCEGKAVDL